MEKRQPSSPVPSRLSHVRRSSRFQSTRSKQVGSSVFLTRSRQSRSWRLYRSKCHLARIDVSMVPFVVVTTATPTAFIDGRDDTSDQSSAISVWKIDSANRSNLSVPSPSKRRKVIDTSPSLKRELLFSAVDDKEKSDDSDSGFSDNGSRAQKKPAMTSSRSDSSLPSTAPTPRLYRPKSQGQVGRIRGEFGKKITEFREKLAKSREAVVFGINARKEQLEQTGWYQANVPLCSSCETLLRNASAEVVVSGANTGLSRSTDNIFQDKDGAQSQMSHSTDSSISSSRVWTNGTLIYRRAASQSGQSFNAAQQSSIDGDQLSASN